MRRLAYKPSKTRTIGLVLISSAIFLTFVDIASPDARAQLSESTVVKTADRVGDSITRAAHNVTTRTTNDHPSMQDRQTTNTTTNSEANVTPMIGYSNQSNAQATQHRNLTPTVVEQARTPRETVKPETNTNNHNDCRDYCDEKNQATMETTITTRKSTVTMTPTPPPVHHHVEKPVNHQPAVHHVAYKEVEHTYPTVAQHQSAAPVNRTYHHNATQATETHQPAKVEHRPQRTTYVTNYNSQPDHNYVAAERDVRVEVPQELPSTGPSMPITVSLGGVAAALVARKFFRT